MDQGSEPWYLELQPQDLCLQAMGSGSVNLSWYQESDFAGIRHQNLGQKREITHKKNIPH